MNAGRVGTKILKILVMVNTKTKFPRGILDQAISLKAHDGECERAPDPGLKTAGYVWFFHDHKWKQRYDSSVKRQAPSIKHHAPIFRKLQAASVKLSNQPVQSPSGKHQAQSNKRQASSRK